MALLPITIIRKTVENKFILLSQSVFLNFIILATVKITAKLVSARYELSKPANKVCLTNKPRIMSVKNLNGIILETGRIDSGMASNENRKPYNKIEGKIINIAKNMACCCIFAKSDINKPREIITAM